MSKVWQFRYLLLVTLVVGVVVYLPPIMSQSSFLPINNDTVEHIKVFEQTRTGEANYIYLGQRIIGYITLGIDSIVHIGIDKVFMWLNFTFLFLGGITVSLLTYVLTKNKLASCIALPLSIFGIGAVMCLFKSGTIFNIISIMIILPTILIGIVLAYRKSKWYLISVIAVGILLAVFHPSFNPIDSVIWNSPNPEEVINPIAVFITLFGITNIAALVACSLIASNNKKENKLDKKGEYYIIGVVLTVLLVGFGFVSFTGITSFSSRAAMNMCIIAGIILCIALGLTFNKENRPKVKAAISTLVLVGIVPNLIYWFTFPKAELAKGVIC